MNTVTLEVPTQLYGQLQTRAEAEQTDIVELLRRLLAQTNEHRAEPQPTTRAFQRILDRATDLGVTDLAEQHDHYLYGTEKQ
jgi:uncharacterized membrane protein